MSALEPVGLFFESTPVAYFGRLCEDADNDAGGGARGDTSFLSDDRNESEERPGPSPPRDSPSLGSCDVLEPDLWTRLLECVDSAELSGAAFGYRWLCGAKPLGGLDSGLRRWVSYESVAGISCWLLGSWDVVVRFRSLSKVDPSAARIASRPTPSSPRIREVLLSKICGPDTG